MLGKPGASMYGHFNLATTTSHVDNCDYVNLSARLLTLEADTTYSYSFNDNSPALQMWPPAYPSYDGGREVSCEQIAQRWCHVITCRTARLAITQQL
ncbi:hypothetical protein DM39_6271 [Burkholderia cenocepacia]|uniref:Uncharacterized protein n=1 Tax=Burkholderia cenocepacia TaxID=95486 RepID=A0AAN0VKU5_9BURK|nr:hypothetical protein DM39_6271 [Burkholderia cenocepacia]